MEAKLCPVTGARRGFKRLYNAVQVNAVGRQIAVRLDAMMDAPMAQHSEIKASSQRMGAAIKEAEDRAWEVAPPKTREAIVAAKQGMTNRMIPAGQALGAIDPPGRIASRQGTYPVLTQRTIVPRYQ